MLPGMTYTDEQRAAVRARARAAALAAPPLEPARLEALRRLLYPRIPAPRPDTATGQTP